MVVYDIAIHNEFFFYYNVQSAFFQISDNTEYVVNVAIRNWNNDHS